MVTVTVTISGTWLGVTNNWNDPANWCSGMIPANTTNVIIPVTGSGIYPTISTATAMANDISIAAGAFVTVNNYILQIGGTISNSGIFDVRNGTVEFNGASVQTITGGSTFSNNNVNGLIISNTAGVNLSGPLNVFDSVSYNKSNAILNTNGNLTLKSTATQTAFLSNMNGHIINGDVTVERYIPTGVNHAKSWQLLAVPTSGSTYYNGQTINGAWQEGAIASDISSPSPGSAGNPNAGYGTMITSDRTTAVADGFDGYTNSGPSVKTYNSVTGLYDGPPSTTSTAVCNPKGYFVFARGDRSVTMYNAPAIPHPAARPPRRR